VSAECRYDQATACSQQLAACAIIHLQVAPLNLQQPPKGGCFLFFNLTHEVAALATLCYQVAYFEYGTKYKCNPTRKRAVRSLDNNWRLIFIFRDGRFHGGGWFACNCHHDISLQMAVFLVMKCNNS
jgi:hypothetical protein